ncbi:MAG TPA: hypothetical protein VFP02_00360 [Acidimicrobiales bacterium]|nr:hypothetical protein [Acidimicrobiales bacterium]
MGQPVTVVQKPTSRADVVRFEINRSITGMDPHRYVAGEEVLGDARPTRSPVAFWFTPAWRACTSTAM